jgi:hypothetical protein
MVTVALPDALYERVRETAATASISLEQAQHLMLRKAEACRLLARRGYKVFSSSGILSV